MTPLKLDPARVAVVARPRGIDDVLAIAAERLAADGAVKAALDALRQREQMGSTAIGHGVAIPHGRLEGLAAPTCALLRLDPAVEWTGGHDVDLVFALLVPPGGAQAHLQLLADVATRLDNPAFRDALRNAPDAASMRTVFEGSGAA